MPNSIPVTGRTSQEPLNASRNRDFGGHSSEGQARAAEIKRRYAAGDNLGDGHVKQELAQAINTLLAPMRERRTMLDGEAGDAIVLDVIKKGVKRANAVAEETLHVAKKAMGLEFGPRTIA